MKVLHYSLVISQDGVEFCFGAPTSIRWPLIAGLRAAGAVICWRNAEGRAHRPESEEANGCSNKP